MVAVEVADTFFKLVRVRLFHWRKIKVTSFSVSDFDVFIDELVIVSRFGTEIRWKSDAAFLSILSQYMTGHVSRHLI